MSIGEGIAFDLPKNQSSVIKVIGVGGGGSNAVNHMFRLGIKGVDFAVCNTDSQALDVSPIANKIQLGVALTKGLGAGADPEIGEKAAKENLEEIRAFLETGTEMVFINAGMGGGTGTGAAPIIARTAREMDILTVGIVTIPFTFEGKTRRAQAEKGIEELREHVDTLIVINNDKIREVYGNVGFKVAFSKADEILATASKGISEVITQPCMINIDLNDARTVLKESGTAIMGTGVASGDNRAEAAVQQALHSPLLNDNHIRGAKKVLLLIISGSEEITFDEIGEINDLLQLEAGGDVDIIMGVGEDENLSNNVSVTVIATGFEADQQLNPITQQPKRVVHTLNDDLPIHKTIAVSEELKNNTEQKESDTAANEIKTQDGKRIVILDMEEEEAHNDEHQATLFTEETQFEDKDDSDDDLLNFSVSKSGFSETTEDNSAAPQQADSSQDKIIRHTLDDSDFSDRDHNAGSDNGFKAQAVVDTEVDFSVANETEISYETTAAETAPDPIDMPVEDSVDEEIVSATEIGTSEDQIERARERKLRLQSFNYKFRNTKAIEDAESEPAYKRQGINLSDVEPSSSNEVSRYSLDEDQGEIKKNNNSFLHDNVD